MDRFVPMCLKLKREFYRFSPFIRKFNVICRPLGVKRSIQAKEEKNMASLAFAPQIIERSENKVLANIASVILGTLLLAVLAQIALPLPWTPVPITGQTLGVSLVSLLLGWKRGSASVALYLIVGSFGVPVFATAGSAFLLGPTFGYLVGMAAASVLMGQLADWGMSKKFGTALVSCYIGSLATFGFGIIGLSFFVSSDALLWSGVIPFLPGDFIKNVTAASIVSRLQK